MTKTEGGLKKFMNAHDKFKKGDRVILAQERQSQFKFAKRSLMGTVEGFSRDGVYVRVKADAIVKVGIYHIDFWEVVTP